MAKAKRGLGRLFKLPGRRLKWNARNKINGITLLGIIKRSSVAAAFLDPQYRGVLDKMKYGNEGARQKGRAKLRQMTDSDIIDFIDGIVPALKPSGHLFLWCDKFTVASGRHLLWWERHIGTLHLVDKIVWNKIVPGMGRRSRCYYEEIIVLQKEPRRAKGVWTDRGIMDCWPESADRTSHAHAKPVALSYRLIRAVTKTGDIVLDPAAGGYGVLDACLTSGRNFIGGDVLG